MKCFYHSADLDGKCSGAIVKHRFPNCEMIGFDYGLRFPWETIEAGEQVIMVDVSLDMGEMMQLHTLTNFTWIDHHLSAMKEADAKGFNPPGVRTVGLSACELAWAYFFPTLPLPRAVRLLGRYDVWDKTDPNAELFNYGMRGEESEPGEPIWLALFLNHKPDTDEIIKKGLGILRYQDECDALYAKQQAFDTMFEGLPAVVLNVRGNSRTFKSVYRPLIHELMIMFYLRKDGKWNISLYSDKSHVDCSAICKKFGGGGHKGAAGFQPEELPQNLKNGIPRK